jgi:anti-anti-sigma factor
VTLICDTCGADETTAEVTHDTDVVWPLVGALGWTGSPFATGKHLCPPCSAEPPTQPSLRTQNARLHSAAYELHVHDDLDAVVIAPLTDLDAESAVALKPALEQATRSHRRVLLDMRSAEIVDSAGLGIIVRARQDAKQHGGTLALAAPSRYVLTVLHTMRLDRVFDIFIDRNAALDAFRPM